MNTGSINLNMLNGMRSLRQNMTDRGHQLDMENKIDHSGFEHDPIVRRTNDRLFMNSTSLDVSQILPNPSSYGYD